MASKNLVFYPDEEWVELPRDSDYLVSTFGRLYDVRRRQIVPVVRLLSRMGRPSWAIRAPKSSSSNNYISCSSAVLGAFVGPGRGVVYKDGNPDNFKLSNLSWRRPG